MKALVKTGKGRESVKLLDIPVPQPGDDEVLIKVMACGICGTDEHIMNDAYAHTIPVTLGHEFTGIVTEIGSAVKNLKVGDQVVALSAQRSCGSCKYCRMGDYVHCTEKKSIGIDLGGGMAEYLVTTADRTFKVPDNLPGGIYLPSQSHWPAVCGPYLKNPAFMPGMWCLWPDLA